MKTKKTTTAQAAQRLRAAAYRYCQALAEFNDDLIDDETLALADERLLEVAVEYARASDAHVAEVRRARRSS